MAPLKPHVIVLFGASGDLAKRKLLPGLLHLHRAGLMPTCRIIGTSLDDLDDESFRNMAAAACAEFASRTVTPAEWASFGSTLRFVPTVDGATALRAAVKQAEDELGNDTRRLHYLSVPPGAALDVVQMLGDADLVERSRIIMEKPFGTDLRSARLLNARAPRDVRGDGRSSASTTSSARKRRRTSSPSGSPTACSSRSGTVTTSTTSRSTSPRRSASSSASGSTKRRARTATWW